MTQFDSCLAFTYGQEGGYVEDAGGPTNRGITQADLSRWRGYSVTAEDVRDMREDEAAAIYHWIYWNGLHCSAAKPGEDLILFDCAVNPGPSWTAAALQRAVGAQVDGRVGPLTMLALKGTDPKAFIENMSVARALYYRTRLGFSIDGHGWLRRTEECRVAALAMVVPHA